MTFSNTITDGGVMGAYKIAWGTFTNTSTTTGGDLDTGLRICHSIILTSSTAASAGQSSVYETLPIDGSAITVVTSAGVDGTWFAVGK